MSRRTSHFFKPWWEQSQWRFSEPFQKLLDTELNSETGSYMKFDLFGGRILFANE
jgi:hypothetical protein